MNKQKQFIAPGSYASPTCELARMHTRYSVLQVVSDNGWNYDGGAGNGGYIEEEEEC